MIHVPFLRIRFTAHSFRAPRGRPTPGREAFISHMKATSSCPSPQHHSPSSCLQPPQADAPENRRLLLLAVSDPGRCVCFPACFLSGGRAPRDSMWPCARTPPCYASAASPSPARSAPRPALPLCSVASVCGGPVRSLGAGVTHGPSFVVSALRATAAACAVLLGRGPEDRPAPCRAGAPAGRAKLARDCTGAGPWTAAGQPRGSAHPTPPLSRIIQVSKPAILQAEHFVNLQREQIQQSRVEPFFFFFFERSVTLICPPLPSRPCGPPPLGIRSERWEAWRVCSGPGLGWGVGGGGSPVPRTPKLPVTPQSPDPKASCLAVSRAAARLGTVDVYCMSSGVRRGRPHCVSCVCKTLSVNVDK